MAITQSDIILQELLNQTNKSNDNLSAMREVLIDMNKTLKKGSKPGSGSSSSGSSGSGAPRSGQNDSKTYSNMFKNMFGNMKGAGSTILGNNSTAANVTASLGMSVKGVAGSLSKLPGPIGTAATAFSMVADAGMAVYEYLNAQLTMYNELNSAGLVLATGITTLERGAASSLMSVNEFGAVLTKNSEVVAAMEGQYGNGVEAFGSLMNSVQKLQAANGLYGVSQSQLADLAAKNFKYQKIYSAQEGMRNFNAAASTDTFVKQMVTLSRSVGKSVDDLMGRFDNLAVNVDSKMNARALSRIFGMAEDDANEVNQAFNIMTSALGESGDQLQKLTASKTALGKLPDEMDSWFTQMLTDRMLEVQKNKVKDPEVMRKSLTDFIQKNGKALQDEIDAQVMAGNTGLVTFLESIRDSTRMLNNNDQQVEPVLEEFTNRFNTWMQDTITGPFKTLWANTRDSTLRYLMDTYDAADGFFGMPAKMIKDLAAKFDLEWSGMASYIVGIPGTLLDIVFNDTDNLKKAFKDFIDTLIEFPGKLASYVWSLMTGEGVQENLNELKDSIGGVFSHIGAMFNSLTDLTFSYDDMKSKIMDSFESMKSKMSAWWDSAKSWFSGEDPTDINKDSTGKPVVPPPTTGDEKKKPVPKPVEPPQYTKPEKVDKGESTTTTADASQTQKEDQIESIMKRLNSIVSLLEQANQTSNQSSGYIRIISENTAPDTNL